MAILKFYVSQGLLHVQTGKLKFQIKATSGKGNCMNNPRCANRSWVGPIPEGRYYAYGAELTDRPFLWDVVRSAFHGDFGDWRIPLHSDNSNLTHSRGGFFLHCGTEPGSAGCIDVGGGYTGNSQTDYLKSILQKSQKSSVWVL